VDFSLLKPPSVALYLASLAEVGTGRILTRVQIAAIAWGVNIASGIMNTVGTKGIGRMSTFNVWWTLGGTLVLVRTRTLTYVCRHLTAPIPGDNAAGQSARQGNAAPQT
jgi:hypothetical protein